MDENAALGNSGNELARAATLRKDLRLVVNWGSFRAKFSKRRLVTWGLSLFFHAFLAKCAVKESCGVFERSKHLLTHKNASYSITSHHNEHSSLI